MSMDVRNQRWKKKSCMAWRFRGNGYYLFTNLIIKGAFLVSGLMHEWIIACISPSRTTFEQFNFFLIHGIITISQVLLEKFLKNLFGHNPFSKIPSFICVPVTWILFLMTTPFFVNPWIRDDIINRIRMHTVPELLHL